MAIGDHPGLRFGNQRAGTWGNAQVKTVEWTTGAVADEFATRVMKIEPGMQIRGVRARVTNDIVAGMTFDIGYSLGERDNTSGSANGDPDHFYDGAALAVVGNNVDSWSGDEPYRPLVLSEVGYITFQNKTAITAAQSGRITIEVEFEYIGND